ncbi:MAG: serine/threonine protein kinase [Candidatus Omnitrophica bacterium]|nr:serine/threonine protein kinase [Candidatus Omnitrophota bacterium]
MTSLGLCFFLAAQQSLYAASPLPNISGPSSPSVPNVSEFIQALSPYAGISDFSLPEGMDLETVLENPAQHLLIYIEDAHGNISAQKNTAEAIRIMSETAGLEEPWIALEGTAPGEIDHSTYSQIQSGEIRKQVVEYFVEQGEFDGADLYTAIYNPKARHFGIDAPELVEQNRRSYRDYQKLSTKAETALVRLIRTTEKLKNSIYSRDLLAFDKLVSNFEANRSEFHKYLVEIYYLMRQQNLAISAYPHLEKLFGAVLPENLKRHWNKDSAGLGLANLESGEILAEIQTVVSSLWDSLLDFQEARDIYALDRTVRFYRKLLHFELSAEEYDEFVSDAQNFELSLLAGKIKRYHFLLRRFESRPQPADYDVLKNARDVVLPFYEAAHKRNQPLADHLKKLLERAPSSKLFLIAGGFHRQELVRHFGENQIPYVILTPKITEMRGQENYWRLMGAENRPISLTVLPAHAKLPKPLPLIGVSAPVIARRYFVTVSPSGEDPAPPQAGYSPVFRNRLSTSSQGLVLWEAPSVHSELRTQPNPVLVGAGDSDTSRAGILETPPINFAEIRRTIGEEQGTISAIEFFGLKINEVLQQKIDWEHLGIAEDDGEKIFPVSTLSAKLTGLLWSKAVNGINPDDFGDLLQAVMGEDNLVFRFGNFEAPFELIEENQRIVFAVDTGLLKGLEEQDSPFMPMLIYLWGFRAYFVEKVLSQSTILDLNGKLTKAEASKRDARYVGSVLMALNGKEGYRPVNAAKTPEGETSFEAFHKIREYLKDQYHFDSKASKSSSGFSTSISNLDEDVIQQAFSDSAAANATDVTVSRAPAGSRFDDRFEITVDPHVVHMLGQQSDRDSTFRVPGLPAASQPPHIPVVPGYEIIRYLGQGGQAYVYLAHDRESEKMIYAVKIYPRRALEDKSTRARIKREMLALYHLQTQSHSDDIFLKLGASKLVMLEDGSGAQIVEFVDGKDLKDWQDEGHVFTEKEIEFIAAELIRAQRIMAKIGIVHRDIKPANIMFRYDEEGNPHIKIMDFGLAYLPNDLRNSDDQHQQTVAAAGASTLDVEVAANAGDATEDEMDEVESLAAASMSRIMVSMPDGGNTVREFNTAGGVLGTPSFLAPELATGEVDAMHQPSIDLFEIGTTLYTLLTGRPPYNDRTIGKVVYRAAAGVYETPQKINARISNRLNFLTVQLMTSERALSPEHFRQNALGKEFQPLTLEQAKKTAQALKENKPLPTAPETPLTVLGRLLRLTRWVSIATLVPLTILGAVYSLPVILLAVSAAAIIFVSSYWWLPEKVNPLKRFQTFLDDDRYSVYDHEEVFKGRRRVLGTLSLAGFGAAAASVPLLNHALTSRIPWKQLWMDLGLLKEETKIVREVVEVDVTVQVARTTYEVAPGQETIDLEVLVNNEPQTVTIPVTDLIKDKKPGIHRSVAVEYKLTPDGEKTYNASITLDIKDPNIVGSFDWGLGSDIPWRDQAERPIRRLTDFSWKGSLDDFMVADEDGTGRLRLVAPDQVRVNYQADYDRIGKHDFLKREAPRDTAAYGRQRAFLNVPVLASKNTTLAMETWAQIHYIDDQRQQVLDNTVHVGLWNATTKGYAVLKVYGRNSAIYDTPPHEVDFTDHTNGVDQEIFVNVGGQTLRVVDFKLDENIGAWIKIDFIKPAAGTTMTFNGKTLEFDGETAITLINGKPVETEAVYNYHNQTTTPRERQFVTNPLPDGSTVIPVAFESGSKSSGRISFDRIQTVEGAPQISGLDPSVEFKFPAAKPKSELRYAPETAAPGNPRVSAIKSLVRPQEVAPVAVMQYDESIVALLKEMPLQTGVLLVTSSPQIYRDALQRHQDDMRIYGFRIIQSTVGFEEMNDQTAEGQAELSNLEQSARRFFGAAIGKLTFIVPDTQRRLPSFAADARTYYLRMQPERLRREPGYAAAYLLGASLLSRDARIAFGLTPHSQGGFFMNETTIAWVSTNLQNIQQIFRSA